MAAGTSSSEAAIRDALARPRWAVVGCSDDPARDSNRIARLLIDRGYEVVPVNPNLDRVLDRRCHPDLRSAAAEQQIDVVDLFRRSSMVAGHVHEAIEIGAGAVWMQLGVIDAEAGRRAAEAGLTVVMDRCPAIELPRLGISGPDAPGPRDGSA